MGKGLEENLEFTFQRNTGILPVLGGGRPDRPDKLRSRTTAEPAPPEWPCSEFPREALRLLRQMPLDELLGRDGLGLVAGADEGAEMVIGGDDVIGLGDDGAVGKFIVVRVVGDEVEAVGGGDVMDMRGDAEEAGEHLPASQPGALGNHFFIFQQDFRTQGEDDLAIEPCPEDGMESVACGAGL